MNKTFVLLLSIFLVSESFSQKFVIHVKNVQNFEHPVMSTNLAIKNNNVFYKDAGTADATYEFDLESMKLKRNTGVLLGEFEIIKKFNDQSIFNVDVKFTNGKIANYIFQEEDNGNKTLICRWYENDKIVGWFDRTL